MFPKSEINAWRTHYRDNGRISFSLQNDFPQAASPITERLFLRLRFALSPFS